MSFFSKLFGRTKAPSGPVQTEPTPAAVPAPVARSEVPDEIALLSLVGQAGGPDEPTAARLLATMLAGPRQREAIGAVARAMEHASVPERMRIQCAHTLVARGDGASALRFLDHVSDVAALMLKADLLHDDGQIAMAVSVIERVLARDIDTPGARERHARWRSALAPVASRPRVSNDVTMAVPTVQQSPFRIVREVARGGAGTVYEAKDDIVGRNIALKVYHQVAADHEQIRREARVAVRLAGAGIVQVYDVDFARGWIALEWAPAGSLREVFARANPNELREPSALVRALAHALGRVHAQGWVHADVKPANVLVRETGEPVLSDFGIAVRINDESLGGSAGFLSPERLAGAPIDPSDDVYGFGRIIEDAMVKAPRVWSGFQALAERCMAPRGTRPADGMALLASLDGG